MAVVGDSEGPLRPTKEKVTSSWEDIATKVVLPARRGGNGKWGRHKRDEVGGLRGGRGGRGWGQGGRARKQGP
jgi:hypothetical protein